MHLQAVALLAAFSLALVNADDKCEVCVNFMTKFYDHIGRDASDMVETEAALMKYCKKATGKDNSFCYYVGALDTSATRIITSITKPLSYGKPVEKICKDLGKLDAEICELEYEKPINLEGVDLNKMRVRDLKKILSTWDEPCVGCAEKRDFIDKINELKPLHTEL